MTLLPFLLAVSIGSLPPSDYADTEVSTNIPFVVERARLLRLKFTVSLDATPSNNVEIAIGRDANGDGQLSLDEMVYVFGYDCGTWFSRDGATGCEAREPAAVLGRSMRTFELRRRDVEDVWNMLRVTRRGEGASCERVLAFRETPMFLEVW